MGSYRPYGSTGPGLENHLLARLCPDDYGAILPRLELVSLPARRQLETQGRPIDHVYFLASGVATVITSTKCESEIEVGLIGNEGLTGLALFLGDAQSSLSIQMHIGGHGVRISAADLLSLLQQRPSLRATCLAHVNAFMVSMSYGSLAHGRGSVEERVARRLLMVQDRIGDVELPLTNDCLAYSLGVRAAGISVALKSLRERGYIAKGRASLTVANRAGLESMTRAIYGAAEQESYRLTGWPLVAREDHDSK